MRKNGLIILRLPPVKSGMPTRAEVEVMTYSDNRLMAD